MQYREFQPPASLAAHVQCVWRLRDASPPGAARTIFPDGRCELMVHLGTPPRCWDVVDGWHAQSRTLFAAQRVVAVRLEAAGPLDCIGVRLHPAANASVMPGALTRRDCIVDLAALDTRFSRALARATRNFAAGDSTPLWHMLTRRISGRDVDARIAGAVASIESSGGRARVAVLARASALSMRGFQIRFRAAVGLTPKEFARLSRLQVTLRALDSADASIAALASDVGFADQAHVTRELRRATGLTPARLRAELRRHLDGEGDGDAAIRMAAAFVRGTAG